MIKVLKKYFKRFFYWILAVVVCVGSVWLYAYKLNPDTVLISITDNGFVPDSVILSAGSKLIFRNDGNLLHWPASNFHPTHSLYPEEGGCISSKFDACRGLKTGETFEYVVNLTGKWPIHDHLYPGLVMIVEVTVGPGAISRFNPGNLIKEISGKFRNLPEAEEFQNLLYDRQLEIIRKAANQDPTGAWEYLKNIAMLNGEVVLNVHEFSHIIGNEIYIKYGLEGIINCDRTFAFGCYHGVSEKLLQEKGTSVVKDVQDLCLKIYPLDKISDFSGCIHGIGHGLLSIRSLSEALNECNSLKEEIREYCYDGVFMENMSNVSNNLNSDDPWKFCTDLPVRYHNSCSRYQTQVIALKYNPDIRAISLSCLKAPGEIMKKTCLENMGFYLAQKAVGNRDKILTGCSGTFNAEANRYCIIGAATETAFQKYKDWERSSSDLCKSLRSDWGSECLNEIKKII